MRLLGVLALLGCASLACSSPSSGSGGVVGGRGEGSKSAWKPHNGVVLLRQRRSGQSPPPFTGVHKVVVNLRGGAGSSAAKSSPSQTVINIAKYLIGGGMLALPAGMSAGKGTGWVPALGLLIAAMLICAKTFIMVGNTANDSGAHSFKDLWSLTVGPSSAWSVDALITALCFGVCIMYSCFLGDLVSSLASTLPEAGQWLASRSSGIVAVTLSSLLPLVLLRDLSALSYSSLAGLAAVLYVAAFVVFRFVSGSYAAGGTLTEVLPSFNSVGPLGISTGTLVLFSMLGTGFTAHPNAVTFYEGLDGATPQLFARLTYISFGIAAAVYACTMFAGYATFGKACKGLILSNYAGKDTGAVVGRVATGLSIIAGYPLVFSGLRESAASLLSGAGLPSFRSLRSGSLAWTSLTLLLLAMASGIALVAKDVGIVVSLMGSALGSALVYCIPAITALGLMRVQKKAAKSSGRPWKANGLEVLELHLLVLFGAAFGLLGTIITLRG